MSCSQYDIYSGSGQAWPRQIYPMTCGPRVSVKELDQLRAAWAFFEQVEAYDAAVRVRLSGTGYSPPTLDRQGASPWYAFQSQDELILYRQGQTLHVQLFPQYNWRSQRYLGILSVPLLNVYPSLC